jgi:hypothetical protein
MSIPPIPPTPGNINPTDQTRQLRESLKSILEDQGDYNNLLKNAVRDLDKMDKSYEKIEARLASMDKGSINIKQVNQELFRLKQKEYLEDKKLKDLQLSMTNESKQKYILAKKDAERNIRYLESKGQELSFDQAMTEALINRGDQEAIVAFAQEKQLEIAKKKTQLGKDALKTEKQVSRQLGISGNLMKIFAEKIGLGEEAYEAMSFKSRQIIERQKTMSTGAKALSKIFGGWQVALTGAGSILKSAFSAITDPVAIIGGIGLFVKLLKSAFDYIVGIQDKTVKFARAMNMSTEQARQLKMQYASISVANGDLLVNTQKLLEAQTEMVDLLGVTNQISTQNLATNIKLKDIAGVEAETIASITESSIINGKSNESIVKSVFAQVKGLKQATGIQFENKKILKEAASLGGVLGLQFAKYPVQLTKSLLTVKAMGMELKELDSMADSFLDFESSISKEFEAQLLTGKEINLAKARELFLNNDLAGAAAEINKQVGSTADFLKMNRIQQEAFAGAMGMSRDQMGDMLKKQEMLSKLGAKDTDNAREQLRLGLAKYKNQTALSEAVGEEAYQNLVNASLQERIAGFMEKIKQSISDFVEKSGIIEKIEGFMDYLSKPENIRKAIMSIRDVFAQIVDIIASIAGGIVNVLDFFGAISDQKAASIQGFLGGAGDNIRSLGGDLSSVAAKDRAGITSNSSLGVSTVSQSTLMGSSNQTIILQVDGEPMAKVTKKSFPKMSSQDNNQTGKMGK